MEMYKFIVDTREQAPYSFKGESVKSKGLKTGDYSISFNDLDYDNEIVIERKSLDDFIGVCCQSRERFIKELERSMDIPHFYIVIEGSWEQIEKHQYYSKINPNSVIESILGWSIKYGAQFVLAGNRTRGERLTKKILLHFLKYKNINKKEKVKDLLALKSNPNEISSLI